MILSLIAKNTSRQRKAKGILFRTKPREDEVPVNKEVAAGREATLKRCGNEPGRGQRPDLKCCLFFNA